MYDAYIAAVSDILKDDTVAPFQIDNHPVRGRIVRLGPAIHEVLTRHAYPEPVANLLGEACALAALVGASPKFEGRLIVQAQARGPVAYVVADYDTAGACCAVTAVSTPTGWRKSPADSPAPARTPFWEKACSS